MLKGLISGWHGRLRPCCDSNKRLWVAERGRAERDGTHHLLSLTRSGRKRPDHPEVGFRRELDSTSSIVAMSDERHALMIVELQYPPEQRSMIPPNKAAIRTSYETLIKILQPCFSHFSITIKKKEQCQIIVKAVNHLEFSASAKRNVCSL